MGPAPLGDEEERAYLSSTAPPQPAVWKNAVVQCFFSLAICMGTLTTYSSYNRLLSYFGFVQTNNFGQLTVEAQEFYGDSCRSYPSTFNIVPQNSI